jgi:hypothetical protein
MDELEIERFGGQGGFGGPGSHVRSVGRINVEMLRDADRQAIDRLFAEAASISDDTWPDEFRYKIVRRTDKGNRCVEVSAHHVPLVIEQSVHDELR